LSMLGLNGAVPPFLHMPSWRKQGQLSAYLLSPLADATRSLTLYPIAAPAA
jgi:hypothetical protein